MITLLNHHLLAIVVLAVSACFALLLMWAQTRVIRRDESGLVRAKPRGDAKLLMPGWHFGLWRWQYNIVKFPLVSIHH